jgi:hypothetical protein
VTTTAIAKPSEAADAAGAIEIRIVNPSPFCSIFGAAAFYTLCAVSASRNHPQPHNAVVGVCRPLARAHQTWGQGCGWCRGAIVASRNGDIRFVMLKSRSAVLFLLVIRTWARNRRMN